MTPGRRGTAERIVQLDGVRTLAFAAVFFHHALNLPLLWMGVDMFFVLSGFLITRNLLALRDEATTGGALRVFYFRRVLRIMPPYYLALILMMAWRPQELGDAGWYVAFASNVHDAIAAPSSGPLTTMWSIAVEEQFYVVWPFLVLFCPRRSLPWLFAAAIALAPLIRLGFTQISYEAVYRLMPCRMDLLAAGAFLAWRDVHDPAWFRRASRIALVPAALAAIAFAALAATVPTFRTSENSALFNVVGYELSTVFFTCALIVVRGLDGGPLHRFLCTAPMRYVGTISYMAYLLHHLAIDVVRHVGVPKVPGAALALAATLGGAALSWHFLEKPLLGKRHLVKAAPRRRDPATAPA